MTPEWFQKALEYAYAHFGLSGTVLIVLALAALYVCMKLAEALAKKLWESDRMNLVLDRILGRKKVLPKDHTIFRKYDNLKKSLQTLESIKCPLRRKIFIRMLEVRVNTHHEQLVALVTRTDLVGMDHDAFKVAIAGYLADNHVALKREMELAKMPDVILERFNERTADMKVFCHKLVMDVCDSVRLYDNNQDKLNSILEILSALESCIILQIEKVVDTMNGEISALTFEGARCQKGEGCQNVKCEYQGMDAASVAANRIHTMLYVEDDAVQALSLRLMYKNNGINVFVAKSIGAAEGIIDSMDNLDFVLIDYFMKDGNGDALEPLLVRKGIPFAYYTFSTEKIKTFAPVISKNVSPKDLLSVLNKQV